MLSKAFLPKVEKEERWGVESRRKRTDNVVDYVVLAGTFTLLVLCFEANAAALASFAN